MNISHNIKILIAYNNPAPLPNDKNIFIPVHGGRKNYHNRIDINDTEREWMIENTIGDDTGYNISDKNWYYNEMTIVYWAFKNYEKIGSPDYIGLMHYRRHFIFKKWEMPEDRSWTFNTEYNKTSYDKILNYSKEILYKYINNYDIIHTLAITDKTVYEQYMVSELHNIKDLDICISIINDLFPEYKESAVSYLNNKYNYFCNMFIMKKDIFFKYCNWIFTILEKFDKIRDKSNLTYKESRLFISERLTGIFIHHEILSGISHCPLPITLITYTYNILPLPYFKNNNIPIIFSVDDNYAPMLGVTLTSLVNNSSSTNNYDIFILFENINKANKEKIKEIFIGKNNFSLRFINMNTFITEEIRQKMYIEIHVSIATYYRFFIGRIFKNYNKVIYLDSDIIINYDIAELYKTEIYDNWIAAVCDIRESIPIKLNMTVSGKNWCNYVMNTLNIKNPYMYFQAGVLIYNINEFNKNNVEEKLINNLARIKTPILSDQDILNATCYNHVYFISTRWNIEWQILFEFNNYKDILTIKNYNNYIDAINNPYIIHYASSVKPWNSISLQFSSVWWKYARLSPFYEYFILNKIKYKKDIYDIIIKKYQIKKVFYKIIYHILIFKKNKYKEKYKLAKYKIQEIKHNLRDEL